MEVRPGLRVVRGPDWERGNEDGGEGYVGTVVAGGRADGTEDGRHDIATVQWDVGGERHVYRCGAGGKYDLRVIDSAQAGVVHRHLECSGCGSESIAGCVWRCVHCLRYYLCTPCYMKDRHSVWHHFMRIDSPENPRQRTRVRCRYQSGRVGARGVFVGARVVRGRDWRWSDQDGGAGREGTVVEVCGWQSESSRSVAVVEWRESGLKRKYRLGHKGKVDLQCTVAAGGHCYLDHLPLLGPAFNSSSVPCICAGDRALVEMDIELLKSIHEELGTWEDNLVDPYCHIMLTILLNTHFIWGKVGVVMKIDLDVRNAHLFIDGEVIEFTVILEALKQVEGPDILPDDVVRVIDDMAEVHRLQKDGHGWHDDMALSLGQLGRVKRVTADGAALVYVNGRRWLYHPLCLTSAPGEQPEDEGTEADRPGDIDVLMMKFVQTQPNPELFFRVVANGHADAVADTLKKWPEMANLRHEGVTTLHVAALNGRLNVVRVLLEHKADLSATNVDRNETPLSAASRLNYYHITKLLMDEGSDVNISDVSGNTPLHNTCGLGFSRMVALLLSYRKCNLELRNKIGSTPLYISSQCFKPDITRLLLDAGADVSSICMLSANAVVFAIIKGFFGGVETYIEHDQGVINAIKDTCELNKQSYNGSTPLHLACYRGNIMCVECLVGYGAILETTDLESRSPLQFVLAKRDMKPLSDCTPYMNKFHEYVLGADNRIQDVPVYITVACFLVSEGASLETTSVHGFTALGVCSPEYHSLLKLFARPERRGNYRGSLPRHPPPPLDSNSGVAESPVKNTTPTTGSEATPPEVSVSGGDSNKREESEVESVTGPSCFLCEGPCDISFQPCGHTAMCAECVQSVSVKRCPICKTSIENTIKIKQ
ncbi:E3 ubiquitin-protein ligase mib1 [Geodia barretti]|uniref:RING-type E3 ubiquitin transferase n=1 Tax=Geodia barretti TaxID=519541 RepID=A0AA35SS46_GEOBA|nr:E3 ubiquitin-protein ligase mib1 [Geodia barretti]